MNVVSSSLPSVLLSLPLPFPLQGPTPKRKGRSSAGKAPTRLAEETDGGQLYDIVLGGKSALQVRSVCCEGVYCEECVVRGVCCEGVCCEECVL